MLFQGGKQLFFSGVCDNMSLEGVYAATMLLWDEYS
jgi:hypothetical protein